MTPAQDAPPSGPPPRQRSAAALVALLLFAWGQSLLLFDWLRRDVFEPRHASHLVLVLPFFCGAAGAGILAVGARWMGREPVGGATAHRFGLASALISTFAVFLLLFLAPSVERAGEAGRRELARGQVADVAAALTRFRDAHGAYPIGEGGQTLGVLLAEELPQDFPLTDAWGHELHYQSLGSGSGYLLVSTGPDGILDEPLARYADSSQALRLQDDVVIRSGSWLAREAAAPLTAPGTTVDPRDAAHGAGAGGPAKP